MQVSFDQRKRVDNLRKHGIDLVRVAESFFESPLLEEEDRTAPAQEQRFQALGLLGEMVVFVVYALPSEDETRLISARRAEPHERNRFFSFLQQHFGPG